jgi:hypothetical protein
MDHHAGRFVDDDEVVVRVQHRYEVRWLSHRAFLFGESVS